MTSPSMPDPPITVVNMNWGATSLSAIRGVLMSVYDALTEAFESTPDSPIEVMRWQKKHPMLVENARPYKVYLATWSRYWSQYAYQFGHELCHILTSSDRFGSHKHKWFEETVCESASFFALHRIAETWAERPPKDVFGAREFAPHHEEYVNNLEQKRTLPRGQSLTIWFEKHLGKLENDRYDRKRTGVIAVELAHAFGKQPALWRDCRCLNTWDPARNETFTEFLDEWSDRVDRRDKSKSAPEVVRQILGLDNAARAAPSAAAPISSRVAPAFGDGSSVE